MARPAVWLILLVLALPIVRGAGEAFSYVALLTSENSYLSGIRVLGASLKASGSPHQRTLLVTPAVSAASRKVLAEDGWTLFTVPSVENPHVGAANFRAVFRDTFTKLLIWNLTQFEKVIFLDADVVVTGNLDPLFYCPNFCAVVRDGCAAACLSAPTASSHPVQHALQQRRDGPPTIAGDDEADVRAAQVATFVRRRGPGS